LLQIIEQPVVQGQKLSFFSKLCIVVEEADETVFWFDVIKESGINDSETLKTLSQESLEILKIVAMARKNTQPSNHSVTQ
jgi:four helix bundle protein